MQAPCHAMGWPEDAPLPACLLCYSSLAHVTSQLSDNSNFAGAIDTAKFEAGTLSPNIAINNANFDDEALYFEYFEGGDLNPDVKVRAFASIVFCIKI
jgi:hypothetical protein